MGVYFNEMWTKVGKNKRMINIYYILLQKSKNANYFEQLQV